MSLKSNNRNRFVIICCCLAISGLLSGCENFSQLARISGRTNTLSEGRHNTTHAGGGSSAFNGAPPIRGPVSGTVINAETQKPIANATLYHAGKAVHTTPDGRFKLADVNSNEPILVKASGYRQASVPVQKADNQSIALAPFQAKGLYLTYFGVSSRQLREGVIGIIQQNHLNAVVIDVKGDRGLLTFKFDIPLANEIGSNTSPTVKDIKGLITDLHSRGIYVIGRIVVFKDNILGNKHPEWAITDTRTEQPWIDNEQLAWVDPFRPEVQNYNIAIAVEAAKAGFDEIQFDYVRFPTDGKISATRYSQTNNMENRVKTVSQFLERANTALLPFNVYFSADIFGYVPWNYNDTDIGQSIVEVAPHVDYICLMVYPSGYHLGIPGYRQPVQNPREVVYLTLEQAKKRLGGQAEKLRPWLQNFRDYAFDRRLFGQQQIQQQINACRDAQTSGWLLWDPTNKYNYTAEALKGLKTPAGQVASNAEAQAALTTPPPAESPAPTSK